MILKRLLSFFFIEIILFIIYIFTVDSYLGKRYDVDYWITTRKRQVRQQMKRVKVHSRLISVAVKVAVQYFFFCLTHRRVWADDRSEPVGTRPVDLLVGFAD